MATLSTHVLDTALGKPAADLGIRLERLADGQWHAVGAGVTDNDGRIRQNVLSPTGLTLGTYQLTFETGVYFTRVHGRGFYPFVPIVFEVTDDTHYHVPLLLSPYGMATYRGS